MRRFLFEIAVLLLVAVGMSEAGTAVVIWMAGEDTTPGVVVFYIVVWSAFTAGLVCWVDCYLLDGPPDEED